MDKAGKGVLNSCPECTSNEINSHDFDSDNTHCWYTVTCHNCGQEWTEIFRDPEYEIDD